MEIWIEKYKVVLNAIKLNMKLYRTKKSQNNAKKIVNYILNQF
jgi:hypothetical protein